jgi:branched-chain amino acid transport system ATP-binding protein
MVPTPEPHHALLAAEGVTLEFKGVRALHDVSFKVRQGELFSIIGPNGAGKTSLLNCVSGRYQPTRGAIRFDGEVISGRSPAIRAQRGIARTFQNLALFAHMSVIDNIKVGRHHLLKKGFLAGGLYWLTGARDEELEHHAAVEEVIDFLEIQAIRNRAAGTLPYGLRKRVELARAVAARPKLLLLDEPMAGMNLEEKEDMARYIHDLSREWAMTIVMIEHDMGVVMDMSDRVMVLNFGEKIAEGTPAEVSAHPQVRAAYLGGE